MRTNPYDPDPWITIMKDAARTSRTRRDTPSTCIPSALMEVTVQEPIRATPGPRRRREQLLNVFRRD
jgi:hypothetical protein